MQNRPNPEDVETEAVLWRWFALSTSQQLAVYRIMHFYLVAQAGIPAAVAHVVQECIDALAVMRKVADHLGLPEGTSPTTTQFKAGVSVKALGLSAWNVTRVGNAFRQSYKLARIAYETGELPETVEQALLRRRTAGRKRTHDTYIAGIQQFLDWLMLQLPPACDDDRPSSYDHYVDGYNRQVLAGSVDGLLLVKSAAVCKALGLSWQLALAVADCELTHEEAREQHLAAWGDKEGPLHLISAASVAAMLGTSTKVVQVMRLQGKLPAPAVELDRAGNVAWLRAHIEAYRDGQPIFPLAEGWMQPDLVLLPELAQRLGNREDSVRTAIHQRRKTVPKPDGRVGGVHYWTRRHFDSWWADCS